MRKIIYWQTLYFRNQEKYIGWGIFLMLIVSGFYIGNYIKSPLPQGALRMLIFIISLLFTLGINHFLHANHNKSINCLKKLEESMSEQEIDEIEEYLECLFQEFGEKNVCNNLTSVMSNTRIFQWSLQNKDIYNIDCIKRLWNDSSSGIIALIGEEKIFIGNAEHRVNKIQIKINEIMFKKLNEIISQGKNLQNGENK